MRYHHVIANKQEEVISRFNGLLNRYMVEMNRKSLDITQRTFELFIATGFLTCHEDCFTNENSTKL